MTNKIFSVATFFLVAWLTVTHVSTSNRLLLVEHSLSAAIDSNRVLLEKRITALESDQQKKYNAVLASIEKTPAPVTEDPRIATMMAEKQALETQLQSQSKLQELKNAFHQVLESEVQKTDDAALAADTLLGTKKAIWHAGTQHQEVKAELQGLMVPIDALAFKWKSGNTAGSVRPVYNVLKQTIAALDTE